jgi:pimeloyl-ACP methyl ester carboxylesterase
MSVPVGPALAGGFFSYDQIKKSFYMYFFQSAFADAVVAAGDLAFAGRLWHDWSPGYDPADDLASLRQSLGSPENLAAALGYYRALFDPGRQSPELATEQAAVGSVPPQPTLYLHGEQDGCIDVSLARAAGPILSPGSAVVVVPGAGHYLEKPADVHRQIIEFLAG